jgi:hypothetical protein
VITAIHNSYIKVPSSKTCAVNDCTNFLFLHCLIDLDLDKTMEYQLENKIRLHMHLPSRKIQARPNKKGLAEANPFTLLVGLP